MTADEAKRRVAGLAADLILDSESHDVFYLDDDGRPLSDADRRRVDAALKMIGARLRRTAGKPGETA